MNNTPHPSIAPFDRYNILRMITKDYYINTDHMVVSPRISHQLILPEAESQPIINPYLAILHSNAGPRRTRWESLIAFWRRLDITGEAHFQLNDYGSVQGMPLNRRADCNYKANSFWKHGALQGAISFETEDNGGATLSTTPWTLNQLQDIIGILTCISVVYKVWCTAPAYWNDSGIGHHSQFPEWSSYTGKTCPGAARIRQMDWIRGAVANNLASYGELTGWQCGIGHG